MSYFALLISHLFNLLECLVTHAETALREHISVLQYESTFLLVSLYVSDIALFFNPLTKYDQ